MKATVLSAVLVTGLLSFASRVQASPITFVATLLGSDEVPGTGSPGTGFAAVTIDSATDMMTVNVNFSGLMGTTTAAHIHCCTAVPDTGNAGVASILPSFPLFPSGVTSGVYNQTFDMSLLSSYNPAFVTAHGGTAASAEAALFGGIAADEAYLNIHTNLFPGGEIRGLLDPDPGPGPGPAPVPEPASMLLLGSGLFGVARRRFTKHI